MKIKKVFDSVFEVEEYTDIAIEESNAFFENHYDGWKFHGGCSAIVKTLSDGDTVTGRNMDLTISHKAAYIVRTNRKDRYRTVGLSYINTFGPDAKEIEDNGLDSFYESILPFICTDVMNNEGLYIQTNMRTGEFNEDGSLKYGCPGTKPEGAVIRIPSMLLPRYLAENCKNVDECLDAIKQIDIYTDTNKNLSWNFCFLLSDKSGKYGLLEIAKNTISWLPGQQAQTNFYITPEFAKDELYKCGIGRYETLLNEIDDVNNEIELFNLMDKVSYFQIYSDNPKFDPRSEYAGVEESWDINYVLDEKNKQVVQDRINKNINIIKNLNRDELKDKNLYWESVFTLVANCNKKEINVRFFEDDNKILILQA